MRSLWRVIAARWLGGKGSEALTGETTLFDILAEAERARPPAVVVRREVRVSHQAMMSQQDETTSDPAAALEQKPDA